MIYIWYDMIHILFALTIISIIYFETYLQDICSRAKSLCLSQASLKAVPPFGSESVDPMICETFMVDQDVCKDLRKSRRERLEKSHRPFLSVLFFPWGEEETTLGLLLRLWKLNTWLWNERWLQDLSCVTYFHWISSELCRLKNVFQEFFKWPSTRAKFSQVSSVWKDLYFTLTLRASFVRCGILNWQLFFFSI